MRMYRGLTKEGKWVYGWYIESFGHHYIYKSSDDWEGEWEGEGAMHEALTQLMGFVEVLPETVGQFTGLCDKNGKEIYFDSDTVKYTYQIENDKERSERTIIGIVIVDLKHTLSYCVKTKGGMIHHFNASELSNIEIIGNIHENKDLLEGQLKE